MGNAEKQRFSVTAHFKLLDLSRSVTHSHIQTGRFTGKRFLLFDHQKSTKRVLDPCVLSAT